MALSAIARELDALTSTLHDLQARVRAAEPGSDDAGRSWTDTRLASQIDALHVRLDALTAEVHRFQGASARRTRTLDAAG